MSKIQVMAEALANKIAAGEVVERPASVVKELLENAIDAGSTKIEVTVEEGGLSLINVRDNGDGIGARDLPTAFLRHATSKMYSERDLFRIQTLGFRGEALPSIAAVSKLEISSRQKDDLLARTLTLEGGKIIAEKEEAHAIGTSISVRDLFFNTPARLKYIKSLQTENAHIQDVINRLALAHPTISFTLINEGRDVIKTSGNGQLISVIHAIYGIDVAKKMIAITGEHLDFQVTGYLGKPEVTRGTRTYMTILINGRFVRSYVLQKALLEGYHTLLPIHRYPFAVVHITLDPSLVDVNVHPAKLEVRFSKEEELAKWLKDKVRQTLLSASLIPDAAKHNNRSYPQTVQHKFDYNYVQPPPSIRSNHSYGVVLESAATVHPLEQSKIFFEKMLGGETTATFEDTTATGTITMGGSSALDNQATTFTLEPLAQLHGTYILAQNEDGLYMVDQHAAQERIHYERFRKLLSTPVQSRQILAIPYTYETTASEAVIVRAHAELFADLGIVQDAFGERAFLVREIPDWFVQGDVEKQIEEIVTLILQGKRQLSLADIRDQSAQLMACKASIKANQFISKAEMESLLQELVLTENPYTCPHGRPILVHFSRYEIEKMFKRVM